MADAKQKSSQSGVNILKNGKLSKVFLKKLFAGSTDVENNPKMVSYNYYEYSHIDTSNLKKIITYEITQKELALFILMSRNLDQDFNICLDHNDKPHTTSSLSKLAKNSPQSVRKKIKTLIDKGLLYHGLTRKKRLGKVYIANLHLVKGNKIFDSSIKVLFNDLS